MQFQECTRPQKASMRRFSNTVWHCPIRQLHHLGNGTRSFSHQAAGNDLMFSLERSVGDSHGSDAAVRKTNAFQAEVFPDLPIATTWANLWKAVGQRKQPSDAKSIQKQPTGSEDVAPGVLKVMTVAANLRSLADIEKRMLAATTSSEAATNGVTNVESGRAADALLLVSGSHPVRSLPGASKLLPSSIVTLKLAGQLRKQGLIPSETQLWAVANPSVETDTALAEQKVDAGAQVILTQPPFDMESYEAWVDDARRRGVLERAKLLVGHPFISSAGNLAFWLSLSNCVTRPRCRELLSKFTSQDTSDKAGIEAFCNDYNNQLVKQVLSWNGIGGFHVMPITPRSKKACISAVSQGGLLHFPRQQASTPVS